MELLEREADRVIIEAKEILESINEIELEQQATIKARERLEKSIKELVERGNKSKEELEIATGAIEILSRVSNDAIQKAYNFLENSLNSALERMFKHTTRRIKLIEYVRNGQYPQLEIELTVANGKKRSLKTDSGHGIAQIVSILSIISLIVLTNSRRILVIDEVLTGLSSHNREVLADILWQFTEIGFQFLINEHGYIPKGSKVYHLQMVGDVSGVKESYIEEEGVYLDNSDLVNVGVAGQ